MSRLDCVMTKAQPLIRRAWILLIPFVLYAGIVASIPPAVIHTMPVEMHYAAPGGVAKAVLEINRYQSIRQRCSITLTRTLTDTSGYEHKLQTVRLSAAELALRNAAAPDQLFVNIEIPVKATPGPGIYKSIGEYHCQVLGLLSYTYNVPVQLPVQILAP